MEKTPVAEHVVRLGVGFGVSLTFLGVLHTTKTITAEKKKKRNTNRWFLSEKLKETRHAYKGSLNEHHSTANYNTQIKQAHT